MKSGVERLTHRTAFGCAFLASFVIGPVAAQDASGNAGASGPKTAPSLEAEIRIERSLNSASEPISVRFLIHNKSDKPIDLCPIPVSGGVALPLELILGTDEKPALYITYKDEKPVPVKLPDEQAAAIESQPLRIAPEGTVGTRIDLRDLYKNIRYPGQYKLEWRPLDGTMGVATATLRVEPRKQAVIVTDFGNLTFDLMYEQAPRNVENFLDLVREEFYRDKTFHRVIPGFAIQGGCPNGNGTGIRSDGKLIPAEFHDAEFKLGTLAMSHKASDPNSASCQFFITLDRLPELRGHYTVVGQPADEATLRTLQQIAGVTTDEHDRPLRSLSIRSVSLIELDGMFAARKAMSDK